jgi:hypothetical protein
MVQEEKSSLVIKFLLMGKEEQKLMDAMRRKFASPIQVEIATVKSVSETELTCEIETADGTEIPDVRLKASVDEEVVDGIVQIPVVGSSVLVGLIGNDDGTRFVLAFSNVGKVMFYGGEKGPIVIWEDKLKTELDKVKTMLTHIVNVINGTPVPEPGNGASSALQIALKSAIAADSLPDFENLTDDKILH